MTKEELEKKLIVGAKIKIGKKYNNSVYGRFKKDEVITLMNGYFECENGLYSTIEEAPSIPDVDGDDFDSIYHLFGNDFENFLDNQILN
ncbi:hypothetical protein SAMN04489761_3033 [Tenacibaculum sp. MAR_2009_124]|uniref:hypothetical protein n=1 Tax=Tenacibaculum sp. MAR_2009_124 TaxID=1250059 RepID=UPI00089AE3E8|nr:hypothetical protein [Tenacibaculum sp. MAR_2009_124]SEC45272.1 hypothetical protein SAMN04489761_3033 [Tenacibaculum sp. MAR_2009_124]